MKEDQLEQNSQEQVNREYIDKFWVEIFVVI